MKVLIDARTGRKITGIGYYVKHLVAEFADVADDVRPIVKPRHVPRYRRLGLRPWPSVGREVPVHRLPFADVVHGPNFHAFAHPTARRVATIHDIGYAQLPECHPPGMGERLDRLVREAIPLTALFICVSGRTRDAFVDRYGVDAQRCRTIWLGAHERFTPGSAGELSRRWMRLRGVRPPFLLHVGAMVPRKDLGTLMQVFGIVAPRHPSLQLVLAGNKTRRWATDWPKVRRWLREHSVLADRVVVLNYVPERFVADLYREARAVVSTSLLEGFGLPVLEALACGAPVVASSGSAVEEYAGDAVSYGTPREPESYASALAELLASDRHDPGPGLALARRLTWRSTAERTLAAYRAAANMPPA
jgi:glycosyltransferase involved in cell wall biosynthesis